MLVRIRELWRFVTYLIYAKKDWYCPQKSDVLIYDADGAEYIQEYLHLVDAVILHVRGERINVKVLIASFFRNNRSHNNYIDCFIEKVKPKLICTFTDNNIDFYSLSTRHSEIKTLFIQNGMRSYHADIFEFIDNIKQSERRYAVDYMATFGSMIGDEFKKYINGIVVPIGSIKNNSFRKKKNKKSDSVCFVSQYRKCDGITADGKFFSKDVFFVQIDKIVLNFLAWYTKEKNKSLIILPCNYRDNNLLEEEYIYYNEIMGCDCLFSDPLSPGGNYYATDTAGVTVSIDSTLGYESLSRGNRTAIFSIRGYLLHLFDYKFGWPGKYSDVGLFWTNIPEHGIFEKILDHLFEINDDEWNAELFECNSSRIMMYDHDNSIIKSLLNNILNP